MPYKVARKLQPEDAAYLAGLIDGEGTITLSRRHSNEQRQLVVSVSSTESDLVDWVASATGVGKITRKRVVADHHAPGLTYTVSNRQALSVLAQVARYLRSYKRARAELVLADYVRLTPRNGKYSPAAVDARRQFEREFLAYTARSRAENRSKSPSHLRRRATSARHRAGIQGEPS